MSSGNTRIEERNGSLEASAAEPAYAPLGPSLLVFVITAVLATGQMYAVIPVMDAMAAAWHVGTSSLTWMASAFGFGYAGGFVLFGPLADRFGHRRIVVTGIAATTVTTLLVACAPGLGVGIALRVLQGVTVAAFPPTALSYIAERIHPRHRMVTTTAVTTSFLASAVIAQVASQALASAFGWRAVFVAGAAAFAVMAVALRAVMVADLPPKATSPLAAYRAIPRTLATPGLRLLYLATPAVFGSFVAMYTGIQLSGTVKDGQALLALRASSLPAMILIPVLTPWLSRVPHALRVVLGMVLAAAVTVTTGVLAPGTGGLAALLLVFVAAITVATPAMVATVAERSGAARSTALSLSTFCFFVGASLGPQVARALVGHGFGALMYVLSGVLAVAAVIVFVTRRAPATAD
ncbi:MFS transporter [Streptomyces barringtoniae]|uniref:MFS transporter n=1 Tax=Streptomyces barringtoniae TaxID=2892029 RepID=UPI001E47F028|nr:MFS transporter [Streptomyces barringtoniae]MCC5476911.1 MFS transporter [Streptomyces barringtoniae]